MRLDEIEKSEFVDRIKYGKTYADIMYVLDDFKSEVEGIGEVDISPKPTEKDGRQRIEFSVVLETWANLSNKHLYDDLSKHATEYVRRTMDRLGHIIDNFDWGTQHTSRHSGRAHFFIEYDR